jgi:DEAD/DEAH box helicase domain-containing protein
VATNALELGVDIGDLGACVLVGYPGTVASTRQQAGRAGRRRGSSAAVLVAAPNPLDQYIVAHPDFLMGRNPERALINPDNLSILVSHLQCAAYELPFSAGEPFGSVGDVTDLLDFLREEGFLYRERETYHWVADTYPAASVSLRSGSAERVIIQDVSVLGRPEVIGELERESAPILLYEGAIYPHQGQSYLVEKLDWAGLRADVRPVTVEYVTRASSSSTLEVLQIDQLVETGQITRAHGRVRVNSQATAFRKLKRSTHETLGWGEIDLPPQVLETTAYWFTLAPDLARQLMVDGVLPAPLDYGLNWTAQKAKAVARDGGRCCRCGAPERPDRRHDVHHLQPFRTFGYIPGQNDWYRPANALENLITLCSACHRQVEAQVRMRSSLAGLGSVLRNLAPLFLMCDTHDIFVLTDNPAGGSQGPTVTVYERVPAGVGFSQQLYELHVQLLAAAEELIRRCPCLDGCPGCVGPGGEVGPETKATTLELLDAIGGKRSAR